MNLFTEIIGFTALNAQTVSGQDFLIFLCKGHKFYIKLSNTRSHESKLDKISVKVNHEKNKNDEKSKNA